MLIKSREEQDEKKIVRHTSCGWCKQSLDYPRIVIGDTNHTSYHLWCSLQLMTEISTDIAALLADKDLPALSQRILVASMTANGSDEMDAMVQAVRAARQGD